MPDTILIHEYDPNDEIEVIDKFDPDEEVPIDELNESAELFIDEIHMEEAAAQHPAHQTEPEFIVASKMFRHVMRPKVAVTKAVVKTAETILDLPYIEVALVDDDGAKLAKLLDTLTGEE